MLFWRKMMIWTCVSQPEAELAHLGKLISSVDRAHQRRILNDPIHQVILSAYGSIYMNVKDHENENKMYISTMSINEENWQQPWFKLLLKPNGVVGKSLIGGIKHLLWCPKFWTHCLSLANHTVYWVWSVTVCAMYIQECLTCGTFHFWGKHWGLHHAWRNAS